MDWCTKSYAEANHAPVPALAHDDEIFVKGGEVVVLDATPSFDPDGDGLSFLWFCYPEAGDNTEARIDGAPNIHRVTLRVPKLTVSSEIHVILQVTDKGTPALTRYKRVILHVKKV